MTLEIKQLVLGQLQTNCYLLLNHKQEEALIVDPSDDASYISQVLTDTHTHPVAILATHGHFDHILAAYELQLAYSIPFLIHEEDIFLVKRLRETARHFLGREIVEQPPESITPLVPGKLIISSIAAQVIHVPGHTPGSVSLYFETSKDLLVGDVLFKNGGVGRTDFSYSSISFLKQSVTKLLALPEQTKIYSGHGEHTTIEHERNYHLT